MRLLVATLVLAAVSCAAPNQRYYYRTAITQAADRLPKAGTTCWITPDLTGPQAGSTAIAEEEFSAYLVEAKLCTQVEKHPDAVGGYSWPVSDICPCQAGQSMCAVAACPGGAGAALPSIGGFGGGGGGGAGPGDNNRSADKTLERFKKKAAQKLIIYRIDEMTEQQAIIHFRVSDEAQAVVEQAFTLVIPAGGAPRAEPAGESAPAPRDDRRRR